MNHDGVGQSVQEKARGTLIIVGGGDSALDWTLALANLGSLLVGKGAYPEAEALLQKAVKLDDQNSLALSALAELKLATKTKPEDLRDLLAQLTVLTGKANPTAAAWAAPRRVQSGAAAAHRDRLQTADPRSGPLEHAAPDPASGPNQY